MFRKTFYILFALVLVFVLASCKQGKVNTEVFTQDLVDVISNESEIMVSTIITFPVPSEDWISKNKDELKGILKDFFTTKGEFQIVQSGMSTMVKTEIEVPFFYFKKGKKVPLISYFGVKHNKRKIIGAYISFDRLENFKDRIESQFTMASFDLDNFDIMLTIRNTMRDNFIFDTSDVYVDNKPITRADQVDEIVIKPREKKKITLSRLKISKMLEDYPKAKPLLVFE